MYVYTFKYQKKHGLIRVPCSNRMGREENIWMTGHMTKYQLQMNDTYVFLHENRSTKAAKRKGSWAHQQTDKMTP